MSIIRLISKILRTGTFMALILTATACSWNKDSLKTLKDSDTVAVLPYNPLTTQVKISPHISARIDLGKVHNLISREDLDLLKRRNYNIDSTFCLAFVKSPIDGKILTRTKCYTVDLPTWTWEQSVDSLGQRSVNYVGTRATNLIYGIKFLLAPEGESTVLSLDFFRNAVVEYRHDTNEIAFHKAVPQGYQEVGDIYPSRHISDLAGIKERYYIDINVNNIPHSFLISTATGDEGVKLPLADIPHQGNLPVVKFTSPNGPSQARVDNEGWIEFGDRAGTNPVYYYDDPALLSDYIFNPIAFFSQNCVIDFPNSTLYLYPHVKSIKRPQTPETISFIDSLLTPPTP